MTAAIIPFWQHARDLRARARDLKLVGERDRAELLVAEARLYDDAWLGALSRGAQQLGDKVKTLIERSG